MDTTRQNELQPETSKPEAATYEPPKVESVLTAEELAREVQYVGITAA